MNFSNAPPTNLQYGPDTPALYAILNQFERMKTRMKTGELSIRHLNIHSLPPLPDRLKTLDCGNNKLTSLPPLPDGLESLVCGENQLTSLPPLPKGLTYLSCEGNQLTSLPPLPKGLTYLSCEGNQLTSLPPLPNTLQELYCNFNNLTSLPPLPDGLQSLHCHDNLNLVNITGKCPSNLNIELASEVFVGCPNLVPQPNPDETLYEFFHHAAITEELIVPEGSENSIMMSEIQNGNILANFHNEKNFKRYYLKSTVNQLKNNPSTRNPIKPRNIKLYTARLNTRKMIGGKTRRNKKRKAQKTRKI